MKKNFDDSFYIEIIDNNFATNYDKNMLVKISKKLNINTFCQNTFIHVKIIILFEITFFFDYRRNLWKKNHLKQKKF